MENPKKEPGDLAAVKHIQELEGTISTYLDKIKALQKALDNALQELQELKDKST